MPLLQLAASVFPICARVAVKRRNLPAILVLPVCVIVREDLRALQSRQVTFEERAERLDGEIDQGGQVWALEVADVHVIMSLVSA
jgi:hypothetical protein